MENLGRSCYVIENKGTCGFNPGMLFKTHELFHEVARMCQALRKAPKLARRATDTKSAI